MVTSLRLALALVACLTAVGCAAEPASRGETPVADDKGSAPPVKASSNGASDNDGDGTLPVTPVGTGDVEDRLPPPQGGDEASKPPKDPAGTTPAPATPAFVTKECKSEADGHVSIAKVTYTLNDGVVKVTKMTFLVTNKDQRNENDADIFLTPKGASEEKVFWTKDILESGKTVEVTDQAKVITTQAGAKLRIETNFDRQLLTDPHADCAMTF